MRFGWFVLVLACDPEPWSSAGALESVMSQLDADESGGLEKAEWDANAYVAPPFEEVDRDGDGTLSSGEFYAVLFEQDPLSFDQVAPKSPPDQTLQSVYFADGWTVRVVRDALRFQVAEIRAVDPQASLPDSEEILRVARGADQDSTEFQALCGRLLRATESVSLQVPGWLSRCGG